MMRALYSAASGMTAQQLNVDNIANNLANANTTGYKTRRSNFEDLLYQTMTPAGSAANSSNATPAGLQIGLGARAVSNEMVFTQGSPTETDGTYDVAIQGRGFFQIRQKNGEMAYTRSGAFHLDRDGNIVTAQSDYVEPQIHIPTEAQTVTIATDGTVSYTMPGSTQSQQAGQFRLANFQNPGGLNSLGSSLYSPTDASGEAVLGVPGDQGGTGTLLQKYVEQSNVNVVQEFVNLIVSQRAYEANSKVVKAADDMSQQVNNLSR